MASIEDIRSRLMGQHSYNHQQEFSTNTTIEEERNRQRRLLQNRFKNSNDMDYEDEIDFDGDDNDDRDTSAHLRKERDRLKRSSGNIKKKKNRHRPKSTDSDEDLDDTGDDPDDDDSEQPGSTITKTEKQNKKTNNNNNNIVRLPPTQRAEGQPQPQPQPLPQPVMNASAIASVEVNQQQQQQPTSISIDDISVCLRKLQPGDDQPVSKSCGGWCFLCLYNSDLKHSSMQKVNDAINTFANHRGIDSYIAEIVRVYNVYHRPSIKKEWKFEVAERHIMITRPPEIVQKEKPKLTLWKVMCLTENQMIIHDPVTGEQRLDKDSFNSYLRALKTKQQLK